MMLDLLPLSMMSDLLPLSMMPPHLLPRQVWMDVVERVQLVCILIFVAVEDMDTGTSWVPR